MIGILLAGGKGTRLHPITRSTSKHLLPLYDKPMIYYSLTTLMFAGVRTIFVIVNPEHEDSFRATLGDGTQWGLEIQYLVQDTPKGIADCFNIVPKDYRNQGSVVALGDNVFYGSGLGLALKSSFLGSGALCFAYEVASPQRYGVVSISPDGRPLAIEEKPLDPKSRFAIPGLYWFDAQCFDFAASLNPSKRGELEITDLLRKYLDNQQLQVRILPRGTAWLDTGEVDSLMSASDFIAVIQERQGQVIGSPEEVAFREGLISRNEFCTLIQRMPDSRYKNFLEELL